MKMISKEKITSINIGSLMKILKAIISTYLETGDPVGSRTIAKDYFELF